MSKHGLRTSIFFAIKTANGKNMGAVKTRGQAQMGNVTVATPIFYTMAIASKPVKWEWWCLLLTTIKTCGISCQASLLTVYTVWNFWVTCIVAARLQTEWHQTFDLKHFVYWLRHFHWPSLHRFCSSASCMQAPDTYVCMSCSSFHRHVRAASLLSSLLEDRKSCDTPPHRSVRAGGVLFLKWIKMCKHFKQKN